MPLYNVSGSYKVTKYVDRIVRADNITEAKVKAWSEDYVDEVVRDEETIGDFESDNVEEIGK